MSAIAQSAPHLERSACILGALRAGPGSLLAQGAVARGQGGAVTLGAGSALLENGVLIGTPALPARVGRRALFGHRCIVIGAKVGDLCEIGNGSVILDGAVLGRGCFLGEGTLVPAGAVIGDDSVVVGRPGRVIRRAGAADRARLLALRGGDLTLPPDEYELVTATQSAGAGMGTLYQYRDKRPHLAATAVLFESAEVTGDVVIGERSIIGAGVKIIGDSHGPVRIGDGVQILENSVLHLLPDNTLVLEDGVVIGPGAMIHGCHIGAGSVVEPGAIVCDGSTLGKNCLVRAGSVVKQRANFGAGAVLDGFPAKQVDVLSAPQRLPPWALRLEDLPGLIRIR